MDIVKPSEYFCGAESPEMRITGTLKTKFLCERAPEHMDDHGATFGNRPIWWQPVEEPLLEDESDFDAEALSI